MMALEFELNGKETRKRLVPTNCLDAVILDQARFDIRVNWSLIGAADKIVQPSLVVWQDVATGLILSWCCSDTEGNGMAAHCAAVDMIRHWGVPSSVIVTGRKFSANAVSEAYGHGLSENFLELFGALRCNLNSQYPYCGQVKPNERALRDICSAVGKDARSIVAGAQSIALADFLDAVGDAVADHNKLTFDAEDEAFRQVRQSWLRAEKDRA